MNSESASMDNSTIEEWTNRLSTIIDGFDPNDVFNADKTSLFYRATPDRSLVLSKEKLDLIMFGFSRKGKVKVSRNRIKMDFIAEADIELDNGDSPLQQLDSLLVHLQIRVSPLTAAEYVNIDSCIPASTESDDKAHLNDYIQIIQDDNEDEENEEELSLPEQLPNLPEAL